MPGASEAPFDLRADLFDEAVVLHAGRAGVDAGHAAEACVPVAHDLRVHADLAARREVHEQDAAARGIHLLAPEQVGRTRGKAETAMDAVGDQRRIRGVMIVEGDGRRVRAWVAQDSRRTGAHARPRQMPPTWRPGLRVRAGSSCRFTERIRSSATSSSTSPDDDRVAASDHQAAAGGAHGRGGTVVERLRREAHLAGAEQGTQRERVACSRH